MTSFIYTPSHPSSVYTLYVEIPWSLIGSLVGREEGRLKQMIHWAVLVLPFPDEDTDDIKTALQNTTIYVQKHIYTDVYSLINQVEATTNASFLSGEPDIDEDGGAELALVHISAHVPDPCFNGFLTSFRAILDATVSTLIDEHHSNIRTGDPHRFV